MSRKGVERRNGKIVIVDDEKKEFHQLIRQLPKQAQKRLTELHEKGVGRVAQ